MNAEYFVKLIFRTAYSKRYKRNFHGIKVFVFKVYSSRYAGENKLLAEGSSRSEAWQNAKKKIQSELK